MRLRVVKIEKMFIPEFNENKSLPAAEQVKIYLSRIPGTSEKSNFRSFKIDQKSSVELLYNDNLLVSSVIEKIDNLEIDIDGEIQKIKTGLDLSKVNDSRFESLFTEIRDYVYPSHEELEQGELKA